MDRYQGAEYDVIFLDEATQLKEEWLRQFAACLRGVNEFPKRLYYTCNPGGPGHSYIKRLFIDRRFQAGENPDDYVFIPAKVTDNRALLKKQPDYLRQLEALPRRLRDAWLEGKWDVFQGQVFQRVHRRSHPLSTTAGSPTSSPPSTSPGSGASTAAMTSATPSPSPAAGGRWIYDGRALPDSGAVRLHRRRRTRASGGRRRSSLRRSAGSRTSTPGCRAAKFRGVADPAIWDASRGESIYETALRHRRVTSPGATTAGCPGWMQLHYRMSLRRAGVSHAVCVLRVPGVLSGRCRSFCSTTTDAEDVDTRQEDHVADESRYFCMSRPIPPQKRDTGLPLRDDPLNMRTGT